MSECGRFRAENLHQLVCCGFNPQAKRFTGQRGSGIRGDQRFSRLSRAAQQEATRVRRGRSASRESERYRNSPNFPHSRTIPCPHPVAKSSTGPVSLLTMWTNRITAANSRKHQEFAGRVNSVNNKFELYQQLKDENGCATHARIRCHIRADTSF